MCQGCKFESPPKTGNYLPLLIGTLAPLGSFGRVGPLEVEGCLGGFKDHVDMRQSFHIAGTYNPLQNVVEPKATRLQTNLIVMIVSYGRRFLFFFQQKTIRPLFLMLIHKIPGWLKHLPPTQMGDLHLFLSVGWFQTQNLSHNRSGGRGFSSSSFGKRCNYIFFAEKGNASRIFVYFGSF